MITEKNTISESFTYYHNHWEMNKNDFIYALGSKAKCSANRGVPTDKIKTNIVKSNVAFEGREKQVYQEKNLS